MNKRRTKPLIPPLSGRWARVGLGLLFSATVTVPLSTTKTYRAIAGRVRSTWTEFGPLATSTTIATIKNATTTPATLDLRFVPSIHKKADERLCIPQIIRSFAALSRNRCQEKQREAWYVAL